MQEKEGEGPSTAATPWWLHVLVAVLVIFGVLFFFQTRDPMVLLFALVAAGMFWLVAYLVRGSRASAYGVILRCGSCRGLNPDGARFCNHCGKPL